MTVGEIIESIDKGGYTEEEWLKLQKRILSELEHFTQEEIRELEISEAMESLSMICRAINGD